MGYYVGVYGADVYVWAIASGSLPPGLSLNTATGEITGTPTTAGTYTFAISASNLCDTVTTDSYTIVISCESLNITTTSLSGMVVNISI